MSNEIGETTFYEKKQILEVKHSKSWLKSVSAFANGEGGLLIFGISDDDIIVSDSERISEDIKSKLGPIPIVDLEIKLIDGKKILLSKVFPGQETPYYYVGDKRHISVMNILRFTVYLSSHPMLRNFMLFFGI